MTRIMAIDYGDARIGIALSDPLKIIANGYKTLQNNSNILEEILCICKNKNVESIVMGIPFDQNSNIGSSAQKVINFSKLLNDFLIKNNLNIKFYEFDEGYSTINAVNSMREIKVKRKKKKAIIDQIAASLILSNFLESKNKKELMLENF